MIHNLKEKIRTFYWFINLPIHTAYTYWKNRKRPLVGRTIHITSASGTNTARVIKTEKGTMTLDNTKGIDSTSIINL